MKSSLSNSKLKDLLERLYKDYNFDEGIKNDPIEFPHFYKKSEDIEIAGFISACFAYGRVDVFKPVIKRILSLMGDSPYEFIYNFDIKKDKGFLKGLQYRFNKSEDIACLVFVLSDIIKKHKSLENLFMTHYLPEQEDIEEGLSGFIETFLGIDTSPLYGKNIKSPGFLQFFPSPKRGSACKRMNLFLRWMVRDRDIDFGIWKGISKDRLIIPLDAHILRISKCLRMTNKATSSWRVAKEITENLKRLEPGDPLKYDFALCHQGISKICSTVNCDNCLIKSHL